MEKISKQEFLIRQPHYPEVVETDIYYYDVANKLLEVFGATSLGKSLPDTISKRIALGLTGYIQDVISDAGIWRSFVETNRKFYGWSVPFHPLPEEYVDYELNLEDVRFLVWYILAMSYEDRRDAYPHSADILEAGAKCHTYLESIYDEAPVPEAWHAWRELDFYDNADQAGIYKVGQWLYMHCYLLTPALALTMGGIMSDPELRNPDNITMLHDRLERSMMEDPTGPLALYIPEWVYLILHGKLPKESREEPKDIHPYYEKFTAYTGGNTIAFFKTYEELNEFFINALGWEKGEEHLPHMKESGNFALLVNKHKGMLLARNVARCIAAPENPYYDAEYAHDHAFDLLTIRGLCPGDLLHEIFRNGWLPDARFPGSEDTQLVADNRDFIARCYLQQYYRGD